MNEDQKQPVADATKTQTNGSLEPNPTSDKAEQQNVANSESDTKKEQSQSTEDQSVKKDQPADAPQKQPTQPAVSTPTEAPASSQGSSPEADATEPKPTEPKTPADTKLTEPAKTTEPAQPVTSQPTEPTPAPTQPTQLPKKLSDVVPSSIVWISGMVGNKQYDCAGPFEAPFKIDKPTWPYVNVAPNPKYTNQVFDYDKGEWVPTDAKSQGQLLTDLAKQVTTLKDDSQKHDQSADQSQKMGMQLTKVMLQLSSKVDALNTKIDGIVNDKKDGDK